MDMANENHHVESLIKLWGFEEYLDAFENYSIEPWEIFTLTPQTLKLIIPNAEKRVKFISKVKEYKENSTTNDTQNCSSENVTPELEMLQELNASVENLQSTTADQDILQVNDIRLLLQKSLRGRNVLDIYEAEQKLKKRDLCILVIDDELENRAGEFYFIHSDRFKVLATFIKDLFPKEEKETYYVPYGTDSFGKTIWTGGLLYETYKEVRDDLRRARKLLTRQRTRPNSFLIIADLHADYATLYDELKKSEEITDDIIKNWKTIFSYRKTLYSKQGFLVTWNTSPCLKLRDAFKLIESDFITEYPSAKNLFEEWPKYASKILDIAQSKNKNKITDKDIHNFFKENEISEDQNHINILALSVLPYLVGTVTRKVEQSSKRENLKKSLIKDSFLLHLQNEAQLNEWITINSQEFSQQIIIQAIVVGPLKSPLKCLVYFNKIEYAASTALDAINKSYMASLVFKLQRSPNCPHVWTFFDRHVYKTGNAKIYSKVTDLITCLDSITELPASGVNENISGNNCEVIEIQCDSLRSISFSEENCEENENENERDPLRNISNN